MSKQKSHKEKNAEVLLTVDAARSLWGYTLAVDTEIGGFGYGTKDGDDHVIHEVFLVPQIRGTTEVDYGDEGLPYLVDKMIDDNIRSDEDFFLVKWHTHCKMGVYWSGTDDEANRILRDSGLTYFVDLVVNHAQESKCRLVMYDNPLGLPEITLPLDLVEELTPTPDYIMEDVAKLTSERKYATKVITHPNVHFPNSFHRGWQDGWYDTKDLVSGVSESSNANSAHGMTETKSEDYGDACLDYTQEDIIAFGYEIHQIDGNSLVFDPATGGHVGDIKEFLEELNYGALAS
jgi:hypothetical protein